VDALTSVISRQPARGNGRDRSSLEAGAKAIRGGCGAAEPRQDAVVGETGGGADAVSGEGEHAQTRHFTQTRRASTQPSRSAHQAWTVYSRWASTVQAVARA